MARLLAIALAGAAWVQVGDALACDYQRASYGLRELAIPERTLNDGWSPDSRRIAFGDEEGQIRIYDLARGEAGGPLTPAMNARNPAWTSDGRILFSSRPSGGADAPALRPSPPDIWVMRSDGSDRRQVDTTLLPRFAPGASYWDSGTPAKLSPDGRYAAFSTLEGNRWVMLLADIVPADGGLRIDRIRRINGDDTFWSEVKLFTREGGLGIGSSRGDGMGNASFNPDVHRLDLASGRIARYTRDLAWEETMDVAPTGAIVFNSDRNNLSAGPAQNLPKPPGISDNVAVATGIAVIATGQTSHDLYAAGPRGDSEPVRRLTFDGDRDKGGWASVLPDFSPDGRMLRFTQHQGPIDNGRGPIDRTMLLTFYCPRAAAARIRLSVVPRRARAGRRTAFRFRTTAILGGQPRPVADASIRLGRGVARTDTAGRATIVQALRRPGLYRPRASKAGLLPGTATVRVRRRSTRRRPHSRESSSRRAGSSSGKRNS